MSDRVATVIKNVRVRCEGKEYHVVMIKYDDGKVDCMMEDNLSFDNPELERRWREGQGKARLT